MAGTADVIQPGDVIRVPEIHYRYGFGTLVLRVEHIGPSQRLPDGEWLTVRGMQIAWNGAELGHRQVLVRWRHLATIAGHPGRRQADRQDGLLSTPGSG